MGKKLKVFFNEFKEFALKGNVVSMAVGIIIGGAFSALITSFSEDFIQPIINFICGGFADSAWAGCIPLGDSGQALRYGDFLNAVINFVIQAFVLFLIIKGMNKLLDIKKKAEAPAPVKTKTCPYCQSEISLVATRCPHCTSMLSASEVK